MKIPIITSINLEEPCISRSSARKGWVESFKRAASKADGNCVEVSTSSWDSAEWVWE